MVPYIRAKCLCYRLLQVGEAQKFITHLKLSESGWLYYAIYKCRAMAIFSQVATWSMHDRSECHKINGSTLNVLELIIE